MLQRKANYTHVYNSQNLSVAPTAKNARHAARMRSGETKAQKSARKRAQANSAQKAAYCRSHPCFICRERGEPAERHCCHREQGVLIAEMERRASTHDVL